MTKHRSLEDIPTKDDSKKSCEATAEPEPTEKVGHSQNSKAFPTPARTTRWYENELAKRGLF